MAAGAVAVLVGNAETARVGRADVAVLVVSIAVVALVVAIADAVVVLVVAIALFVVRLTSALYYLFNFST